MYKKVTFSDLILHIGYYSNKEIEHFHLILVAYGDGEIMLSRRTRIDDDLYDPGARLVAYSPLMERSNFFATVKRDFITIRPGKRTIKRITEELAKLW